MKYILILFLGCSSLLYSQSETITFMSYNLLNFPNGRDDCGTSNVVIANRADTLKMIIDYIQPDIFGACEVQTQAGVNEILNQALNTGGNNNFAAAAFSSGGDLGAALFYNTDKLVLKSQNTIIGSPRNIIHYILYLKDPNLSTYLDTTIIDVYMLHLKAGSDPSDESSRAAQTAQLMDYIATQPANHNVFVAGDMNVYSSNDGGYANLIAGNVALKDPINKPGNWHNNSNFSIYHTQATRKNLDFDCGVKGGLDDRFDNILVSQNIMNGSNHVQYQVGSYKAVGNDGNHFNDALIDGSNSMYAANLVNALFYMSDHLPVMMKVNVTYPTSGLALVPSQINVSCNGQNDGSATVTPQLGQAPYTYQWDAAANNQTTATATNLGPGNYCVSVTDGLGTTSSYCFLVTEPDALQYSSFVTPDNGTCSGIIQLLVGGGTPPYSYQWTDSGEDTSAMSGLCAGDYDIFVSDAHGCLLTIHKTVPKVAGIKTDKIGNELIIYPNPTKGAFTILANDIISKINLQSITGIHVPIKIVRLDANKVKIVSTKLSKGIYILKCELNQSIVIKRIVVE